MKSTFAQQYPAYMTAETTQRTIDLGRALRDAVKRRRAQVTITVDASEVDAEQRRLQHSTSRSAA